MRALTGQVMGTYTDRNRDQWFEHVATTQDVLYGWLYMWWYMPARADIALLADQGVDVRIIGENEPYRDYGRSRKRLESILSGTEILYRSDEHLLTNFNHTKTFVSDTSVVVQSANLTQSAW